MAENEDWRADALCAEDDPAKWFPEERNPVYTPEYKEELRELRAICALCPFQRECLEYALQHPSSIDNGIFAGTTPTQRRRILKEINLEDAIDSEELFD